MVYELKRAQRDAIRGLLVLGWSHRRDSHLHHLFDPRAHFLEQQIGDPKYTLCPNRYRGQLSRALAARPGMRRNPWPIPNPRSARTV